MDKRILSSEEVMARVTNFNKEDLSTIYVLSFGSISGSSYADFVSIIKYSLRAIFDALEDDSYIFIEMKEKQE